MTVKRTYLSFIVMHLSGLCLTSIAHANEPLGSRNNPLKVAINPTHQATKAMDSAKTVMKCIEDRANITISFHMPNTYALIKEGFGSNKIDLAIPDIITFFSTHQAYGAEAILKIGHYGTTHYYSMIVVRNDSPIKSIEDLNGAKFGYSDASSASSFIVPHMEMLRRGIKPAQETPTNSMDAAMMALMQKKVDAAAGYYNPPDPVTGTLHCARKNLVSTYPNIAKETRVIWISPPIPNEPVMVRKDLPASLKAKLIKVMPGCFREHKYLINNIDDLVPISKNDKDYSNFLAMIKQSKLDLNEIVTKKK